MKPIVPFALLAALALQGCLAKTAFDVVTAPVKVAGKAVDMATTSQSEADEKRGREMRRRDEELAKLERRYREQREDCDKGSEKACRKARETSEEIESLLASMSYQPKR